MVISLLFDARKSVSVNNKPTYITIAQVFKVCKNDQHDTSKTMTNANQSKAPTKQNISVTRFSSAETKSKHFMVPIVVADIRYNAIWTRIFEKKIQKIKIQDFSMNFKNAIKDQPIIAPPPPFLKRNFPFFPLFTKWIQKKPIYLKNQSCANTTLYSEKYRIFIA